jgi:hypothetical protein
MERLSLGLVCAFVAGLSLLASGSCSSKHEAQGAGTGGMKSGGNGGENAAGSGGASAVVDATHCDTAADCSFGEIDHEIVKKSDCICRFGCPYIPLNKTTIERRNASYAKLCDPSEDGQGKPCPVDDCVPVAVAVCDDQVCRAAPR